jgi:hypothetical protein
VANLADPDIEATLGHIGSGHGSTVLDGQLDADRTADYSVGTAASNGQRFRVLRPHARGGLRAVFVALDGRVMMPPLLQVSTWRSEAYRGGILLRTLPLIGARREQL